MHDRPFFRDASKSSQKRHPLNRDYEGQSPNTELLLTAKVTARSGCSPNKEERDTLYVVTARPIAAEIARFWALLNDGTIEAQEPDGREIVASMRRAVMNGDKVEWQETCYCSPPLLHERTTIYDQFFTGMETEPSVGSTIPQGESFWDYLEDGSRAKHSGHGNGVVGMARYVPVRLF